MVAMIAAGYGLMLYVFYPGVMTYDARFVYEYIAQGILEDWQSPLMVLLWALIDPIAPGPGSMFLLMATIYWLAFGLLAFKLARRSVGLAVVLLLRRRRSSSHHLARHFFAQLVGRLPLAAIAAPTAPGRRDRDRPAAFGVLLRRMRSSRAFSPSPSFGRRDFIGSARHSFTCRSASLCSRWYRSSITACST
jgi:hypothetical protein